MRYTNDIKNNFKNDIKKVSRLGQRRLGTRPHRVLAIKKSRRNWLLTIAKGAVTILPLALSFTPLSSLKWLRYGPLKLIHRLIRYIS